MAARRELPNSTGAEQRNLLAWALLAAVLLWATMAGPFFAGRVYTRDDLGGYHLPARAFYAERLARAEPFDWMPQLFTGFYLTGEGQAGGYHPWHLLLYRCLPLRAATAWEWLAPYPFMLAGMWLFLRRVLRQPAAAMVGSLLFTFSSFNVLHFVHPNAIEVVSHIPWLLWTIDIVLTDSDRGKVAAAQAGIALLTGSQLLLGYPQYVWFSLLAEAGYAGFLFVTRRRAPRDGCDTRITCAECVGCAASPWPRLLIAKGAGLLLGGTQLLPTLDALLASSRQAADATFSNTGSLHPLNLVQLVAPYLFTDRVLGGNTHEMSVYLGAVPVMLVAWVLLRRNELAEFRTLVKVAGWLAAAALVLAAGQYGLLYRLQQYVPLVGRFRCPCRYLVLFYLALTVVAAVGFVLLHREHERNRTRQRQRAGDQKPPRKDATLWTQFEGLWMPVLASIAVAAAGLCLRDRPLVASLGHILLGPALLAVAAVLVVAMARGVRGAPVALVLFAAADLGCYGLSYSVYGQTERLDQFAAAIDTPCGAGVPLAASHCSRSLALRVSVAAAPQTDRVFAPALIQADGSQLCTGDQMTLLGWQRTDGYAGLEPRRQLDYFQVPALRVAGTRWVQRDAAGFVVPALAGGHSVAGQSEDRLKAALQNEDWLEVPSPLPRVRLVTRAIATNDPARDIQQIDIQHAALCEYPLALPPGEPGTATLVAERPGRMEIAVRCATPQLLVVAESFHSGWHAIVDGSPRELLRVNGDFLGCLVRPADRLVTLEFQPDSLFCGRLATQAGVCLVLCCLCGPLLRRRPRR